MLDDLIAETAPADAMDEPILVREGGVGYSSGPWPDPLEVWVELMEAVESL